MKNRSLLRIPGPIEFEPAVLAALAAPTTGHVASDFIATFGQALERMREAFLGWTTVHHCRVKYTGDGFGRSEFD